jgi:phosphatidylethanolamine/phosphatidyl-N-methylethanolamine N-methyltransferase
MFSHALQLLKDTSVASIAPTAPNCVKQMLRSVDFSSAKLIIEYGPGDGAITKYLLKKMRKDARLIIIETNDQFVSILKSRFNDPRLSIVHDTAENIIEIRKKLKFKKADYIISGIPFSLIKPSAREEIIKDSAEVLKDKGKMIIYQALMAISARRPLKNHFRKYFETTKNKTYLLNLPPLYVFEATCRKEPLFI